jgi:multicomponent Na+:H+ antiporter subunit G
MIEIATGLLIVTGSLLALISALGLMRLPDVFTRMHAASKAGTAGSGLMVLAVALGSDDLQVWIKCFATMVFFMLTAPIAAHLLAKAALKSGQAATWLDPQNDKGQS